MAEAERKKVLNKLFRGIGRVEEENDKIICYVDKKAIKDKKSNFSYDLTFYGVFPKDLEESKEELMKYGLDKPIYYVIDGFNFDERIKIHSYGNAKVIFKNCTFVDEIFLLDCVDVEFENNTYKEEKYRYHSYSSSCFFHVYMVRNLTFRNESFVNSAVKGIEENTIDKKSSIPHFGINVTKAKKVEFINTNVKTNFPTVINSDAIRLENSILRGLKFDINAKNIENKDSIVKAITGVIIDNPECDFKGIIKAPLIIYNGDDVTDYSSKTTLISQEQISKRNLKISLIDILKQIRETALRKDTRGIGDIMGVKQRIR